MRPLWKIDVDRVAGSTLDPGVHWDAAVVGAGITGLSTALMLAEAGLGVVVVEAGDVGELASGGNTGKVSLLQGKVLSTLRAHHPASLVRAYVDSNRDGLEWVRAFAERAGVPYTRRLAVSYAQALPAVGTVGDERSAAVEAGLDVRTIDPADLDAPFPVAAAIGLDDQIAIDPQALVVALARTFIDAGGTLVTSTRVRGVSAVAGRLDTDRGPVHADNIVLATGTPVLDRGLYFAKTRGLRSYAVSFRTDAAPPEAMYLSVDGPTRSVRAVTRGDGPADRASLVIGGNGHPVGRAYSEKALVADLVAWTEEHFPGAAESARWSAQDYESHDLIPFVGAMPRGLGRIRFATGYGKWGLTNGPAAGIRLAAEIRGVPRKERRQWIQVIGTRMTVPADIARGATETGRIGIAAATGWLDAELVSTPVAQPPEGEGVVASRGLEPVAISTVAGTTRGVSAVCPHLGGIVRWNDAECTWDCPLHASRFAPDGTRIEGPATADLKTLR